MRSLLRAAWLPLVALLIRPAPAAPSVEIAAAPWQAPAPVKAVALAPDGKAIATCRDRATLLFWDPATGTRKRGEAADVSVGQFFYSPDGKMLVTGGAGAARVEVRDAATGDLNYELSPTSGQALRAAFTPDSKALATVETSGLLVVRDAATQRESHRLTLSEQDLRM